MNAELFFNQLLIVLALSIFVQLLCQRLRVPAIVGFLLTGILAGPSGLKLLGVGNASLAELGVVLLLFTIGLEFSAKRLVSMRRAVLLGGSLQVGVTLLLVFLAALPFVEPGRALLYGFLVALSSTAILLRTAEDRGEIDAPHTRMALGIGIFQDLSIVLMMLSLPLISGQQVSIAHAFSTLVFQGLGIIALVLVMSRFVMPFLMHRIARTRSRELFLFTILLVCLGVPWITLHMGLSLGIGAFLAGMVMADTEYSDQALAGVLPFKDVFASLFFISIGMLLDVHVLLASPVLILGLTAGVLVLKCAVCIVVAQRLGYSFRTALRVALLLSNIGEFSFVLAAIGLREGLLDERQYQMLIAITILSMASTPFQLALAGPLERLLGRMPMPERFRTGLNTAEPGEVGATDAPLARHLVIIGYGVIGRNVGSAARAAGIPFCVIEMNHATVHRERQAGLRILGGDAAQEPVLHRACAAAAALVLIAVPDAGETRKITQAVRRMNPGAHIIARTKFVGEIQQLLTLGAHDVVPDEFEASIEIITRVLRRFLVPGPEIASHVGALRDGCYAPLREVDAPYSLAELTRVERDFEIGSMRLVGTGEWIGQTLAQLDLRRRWGVTLLAIRRVTEVIPNPSGDEVLRAGDVLICFGPGDRMAQLGALLQTWAVAPVVEESGAEDAIASRAIEVAAESERDVAKANRE